ncbi:MAG: GNAT family N-acetyltransferase [Oscillospiraceae bacterium]|nr:GNAT family N-acetyltransferase [Oscillospiraceae bacterium]
MFQKVNDIASCETFAGIYNSAILLFDAKERADATGDIFLEQLHSDVNYIYYDGDGTAAAFFSYRQRSGNAFELTSLYVKRECQRKGVGQRCCLFLEELLPKGSTLYVEVLKNAAWSIDFYHKMGFADVADGEAAAKLGIKASPWSAILRKEL